MNVSGNISIYTGQDERVLRHLEETAQKKAGNGKSGAKFMPGGRGDSILMKKQLARRKAMKIVGDTFTADREADAEMEAGRNEMKELAIQKNELQKIVSAYENMPEEEMTEEMRLEQKQSLEQYRAQQDSLETQIEGIGKSITSTKINRLKSSPMVKAQEEAEEMIESAGEEVLDMLMQEAKEHIDEEQEKKTEEAEKAAEKREEQEEKLEKAGEKQEEREEFTEMIKETASMDDAKREISEMLEKMKLLKEDIKGAQVDELL